jgi:hypothetical protein
MRSNLCANFTPPRNGVSRRSRQKTPRDDALAPENDPYGAAARLPNSSSPPIDIHQKQPTAKR